MIFERRKYQEDSYLAVKEALREGYKKIFLTAPTGSGKSHIGIRMIKEALDREKRVGFLVDRITLLNQFSEMIYNEGIKDFSLMQADNPLFNPNSNLQIMTAQTLGRRTVEPFDLVLYDESHIVYKSVIKLMKEWGKTYWIGLSATPFTMGLGNIWEILVNGTSTAELIRDGYLSKYIAYGPSKPDLKGIRTTGGDYNKKDLAERADKAKLIGDIVEHWFRLASDRKTVVGAVNVAHAEHISEAFKAKGVPADVIHCYQKEEDIKEKIERFKKNDLQLLSSVDMISRGFNMPDVNCLVIARPTKSLNYHLQFIGRGLRVFPNKENCLILDHAGNIERLGFPDDDLEMRLNMGLKSDKKLKKKNEKLPKPCPKCSYLFIGTICPQCKFERKKQNNVKTKEGELKELQKERHKIIISQDKEKLYAKLLAGAAAAGFKEGWAANQYRNYFGTWPRKRIEKDSRFYNFLVGLDRNKMLHIIWGLAK